MSHHRSCLKLLRLLAAAFPMLAFPQWLQAAQFMRSGPVIILNGQIEAGDDYRFHQFLAQPNGAPIRVLYLNSPGGYLYEAYKISEMVRAAGLDTVVDAAHGYCASACTAVYTGGVRRYYLNAQSIVDGKLGQNRGLGFHEASNWGGGRFGTNRQSSYQGSEMMISTYREMGVPGAATLVERAKYTSIYWVSGQTALSLGIATSLGKP